MRVGQLVSQRVCLITYFKTFADPYTGWGGHRRLCNMFLKSSPCLVGQNGSCSTAQQPGELSKKVNKTIGTSGLPTRYIINKPVTSHSLQAYLETHGALAHLARKDALFDRAVLLLGGGGGRRLDAHRSVAGGQVLAEVIVLEAIV